MVAFVAFLTATLIALLTAHRFVADVGERYRTPAMGGTVLAMLSIAPRGVLEGPAAATAVAGFGLAGAFLLAVLVVTRGHPARIMHPTVRARVFGDEKAHAEHAASEGHHWRIAAWFAALAVAPALAAVLWT